MSDHHNEEAFELSSYADLQNIDMDELQGMSDTEMREHFLKLARSAKPAQLSVFLYGRSGNGDESLEEMETDFVERRMSTIRGLNKVKAAFDDVLSAIEGERDGTR